MKRFVVAGVLLVAVCAALVAGQAPKPDPSKFLTQPLVRDLFTADPSAHVFNGKIFIYPSHDIDAGVRPTISAATSPCATITCFRWIRSEVR